MKSPHQLLRELILVALAAASLAACGGSDGGGDSGGSPPPTLPPVSPTPISLDDGHQVGATHWPSGDTSTGGQGQPVGGLDCNPTTPQGFHVHAHLSIFLNGEALAIPNDVGFVGACHYPLHTHNASGMLHVHATAPVSMTLGQFFQIWGHSLTSSNIADLTGMPVVVYVTDNGVVTQNTGDWSAIELRSHREITIQVGTAITQIPNFTWTGN